MPETPSEEVCVTARSSAAALDIATATRVNSTIARVRTALIDKTPLPNTFDPAMLVRYVSPAPTREALDVRTAGALDPADPHHGWVVVEAVSALGRSDVPLHLTVVIDVSLSMLSAPMSALSALQDTPPRPVSRLALAREVIAQMAERMPARTEISLVAFSRGKADIVLPPTQATDVTTIVRGLRRVDEDAPRLGHLPPLQLAYDMASAMSDGCADRRVLIITDDQARFEIDPAVAASQVAGWAEHGIELWTLSLGMKGIASPSIDALTSAGRGVVIYADTVSEALEPLTAALRATGTIGRDPSLTISFSPAITSFRRMDGSEGVGTETWSMPERIDAGFRRVELYEVRLADGAATAQTSWSLHSPVPGEWQKQNTATASLANMVDAEPLVRERVLAWTVGRALAVPTTDWQSLAAWAAPLTPAEGPALEIRSWIDLMTAK